MNTFFKVLLVILCFIDFFVVGSLKKKLQKSEEEKEILKRELEKRS